MKIKALFIIYLSLTLLIANAGTVFAVKNNSASGSAFLISGQRIITTAELWCGENPQLFSADRKPIQIKNIYFLKDSDLVLLIPSRPLKNREPFQTAPLLRIRTAILIQGYTKTTAGTAEGLQTTAQYPLQSRGAPVIQAHDRKVIAVAAGITSIKPAPLILDDRLRTLKNSHLDLSFQRKLIPFNGIRNDDLIAVAMPDFQQETERLQKARRLAAGIRELIGSQREWLFDTLLLRLSALLTKEMPAVLNAGKAPWKIPWCEKEYQRTLEEIRHFTTAFGCGGLRYLSPIAVQIRQSGKKIAFGIQKPFVTNCPRCKGVKVTDRAARGARYARAAARPGCLICKGKGKFTPYGREYKLILAPDLEKKTASFCKEEKGTFGGFNPGGSFTGQILNSKYYQGKKLEEREAFLGKMYRIPFCAEDPDIIETRLWVWQDKILGIELIYPYNKTTFNTLMTKVRQQTSSMPKVLIKSFLKIRHPEMNLREKKANRNTEFEKYRSNPIYAPFERDPFYTYFNPSKNSTVQFVSIQCEHELGTGLKNIAASFIK